MGVVGLKTGTVNLPGNPKEERILVLYFQNGCC
jgi:hypothetical protein